MHVCEKKKKTKKMTDFLKAYISGKLPRFTSDLVCVLSQYTNTHTANLVLFGQEIMELRMHVKSYFILCVNILTLCMHAPFY